MMGLKQKLLKSYKFVIEPKKNTISPKLVLHTHLEQMQMKSKQHTVDKKGCWRMRWREAARLKIVSPTKANCDRACKADKTQSLP